MIISASRRTDIPAFWGEWFYNRIEDGYVCVRNPMNPRQVGRVDLSPDQVGCLVFWTKDPAPFLPGLHHIDNYPYYFLFTVTPYGQDLEPGLPPTDEVFNTFARLSSRIGKHRVVWRYDPVFLSREIDVSFHIRRFKEMAGFLQPYTERCIISFLDVYKKCERNLKNTTVRRPEASEIETLLSEMYAIAIGNGLTLETCAEKMDVTSLGISPSRCIDDRLISRITNKPFSPKKDKNQRSHCGCIESVDIGEYNTCRHFCRYCYANTNVDDVKKKCRAHDPAASVLTGHIDENDQVRERKGKLFQGRGL